MVSGQNARMENLIGSAWLIQRYRLPMAQPLTVRSEIGTRRQTQSDAGVRTERYVESMRPEPTLKGHLTFHLKHEVPNLEFLVRLFLACDAGELSAWIHEEPTGQYARRACFLYEWLTDRRVAASDVIQGGYVDALDHQSIVTASNERSVMCRRWRVRDNMPGTPAFCPLVRKTPEAVGAMGLDVAALVAELASEFGEEVTMKSAVWMTLRESKSSFTIEGEGDKSDRIQRFASVLGRRTGHGELVLSDAALAAIQREILGERTTLTEFGVRRSPVFVGETVHFQEVVHYIAPPAQDLTSMLQGLATFLDRTAGQSPVMRAAVAAFGFIYIHPMADGNGRVHRFLVNDVLRRDGVLNDPLILPISSLIASDSAERRAYDRILEKVSRPLMDLMGGHYKFGQTVTYPDGLSSNLHITDPDLARPVWRMPDLTEHVTYMADVIERTIRQDMREESRYMRRHAKARAAIKDVIEMPDAQIDRVIRSIEANQGKLTGSLSTEIPQLERGDTWREILAAVKAAFDDGPTGRDALERYRQQH